MILNANWKSLISTKDTRFAQIEDASRNDSLLNAEEEEDYIDRPDIKGICYAFTQSPADNMLNVFRISEDIVNSSPPLQDFLKQIQFFQNFAIAINASREFSKNYEFIYMALEILIKFCKMSAETCSALTDGECLSFLKRRMYSNDDKERFLVLKCLNLFAKKSQNSRSSMFVGGFLVDLYSIFIQFKDNEQVAYLISKILTNFLSDEIHSGDLPILRKIAFSMIEVKNGAGNASKILCYFANKENQPDPEFALPANVTKLVQFLYDAKYEQHLFHVMKFFTIRAKFPEEAMAFYRSNIFSLLNDFMHENFQNEKRNEQVIQWSSWLIENIIQNVAESTAEFFGQGMFDLYHEFALNGTYIVKGAAVTVISRVVKNCIEMSFEENKMEIFYPFVDVSLSVIDGYNYYVQTRALDLILSVLSVNPKPQLIEHMKNIEIFNRIGEMSLSEDDFICNHATLILDIVRNFIDE